MIFIVSFIALPHLGMGNAQNFGGGSSGSGREHGHDRHDRHYDRDDRDRHRDAPPRETKEKPKGMWLPPPTVRKHQSR